MLYRALRDLDNGIRKGEMFAGDRLKPGVIQVLLQKEIIAEVVAPPIMALPVWRERAEALGADVETLADVVEADPQEYDRPGVVKEWQKEAKALLQYPAPDGWYLKDPAAVTENCAGCPGKPKRRKARSKGITEVKQDGSN